MTENKPIIYYKKDCLNEPYCSLKEVLEELSHRTQECEELKEEVQQALKKNAENYSNSCLLQKEVNQLKEQIKRLQEDLKIRCDMYFKESYRSYKLSEISCEWNARRCIEELEKFLINDDTLTDKISNISSEIKRFFKECTPNKDIRLADVIPEDEYTKCLKAQEQLNQLKAENEEYKKNGIDLFEQLSNGLKANEKLKAQNEQAEQKLEKIKPILEYYANSYIGEKQLDGTYKYNLDNGNCILYDPRKAKEGLQIIDEV